MSKERTLKAVQQIHEIIESMEVAATYKRQALDTAAYWDSMWKEKQSEINSKLLELIASSLNG